MRRTLDPETSAARAADRAGVEVVEISDLEALTGASRLFDELWGTGPGDSYLSPSLLVALSHAGNYAAGAYAGGALVGAVMGFLGFDAGVPYLHSHILGVGASHRGGNVGAALKQHQRAWALGHGLRKVTWTFDPLVRRNAFFNIQKLGAEASAYLVNFYGEMSDDINGSDESDRLLIAWDLTSDRTERAADGGLVSPQTDGSTVALDLDGRVSGAGWGPSVLCATPDDIVELRRSDPDEAMRWRRLLRTTLGRAMHEGYRVAGVSRSGWYVLERS